MSKLFNRKFSLLLVKGQSAKDLSQFHCTFHISQSDFESPNNARIRVYNLSSKTLESVQEFGNVVLQAGYDGQFGVIFQGNIKQFGIGRENSKDTYLDIFAADGDEGYNFGVLNKTLAPGAKQLMQVQAAIDAMGLALGYQPGDPGVVLPRGKVLFAMGRDVLRQYADTTKATWSIQNGMVQIIPLSGYKPGQILDINSATGLVGNIEQQQEGVFFKHLLNPLFSIGQAVKINNSYINQIVQASKSLAPIPYNQRTGLQQLAKVTADGLYRVLIVEHEGDTRGQSWYSYVTALAIDASNGKVRPYG